VALRFTDGSEGTLDLFEAAHRTPAST